MTIGRKALTPIYRDDTDQEETEAEGIRSKDSGADWTIVSKSELGGFAGRVGRIRRLYIICVIRHRTNHGLILPAGVRSTRANSEMVYPVRRPQVLRLRRQKRRLRSG